MQGGKFKNGRINIGNIKNESLNTLKNNWGTGVLIHICFFLISLLLEVLKFFGGISFLTK